MKEPYILQERDTSRRPRHFKGYPRYFFHLFSLLEYFATVTVVSGDVVKSMQPDFMIVGI